MSKIHFAVSVTPLVTGSDLTALCGQIVPKAQVVSIADGTLHEVTRTMMFCKDCFGARYMYALIAGEESLHP